MCAYNAGDIACFITEMCFIITLSLLIIFICESEEDRNNKYGEIFLFSAGVTIVLWVVSASIKTEDDKKPKKPNGQTVHSPRSNTISLGLAIVLL